jgi:hypothetical protein
MLNKTALVSLAVGLAVVAALVGVIVFIQRGSTPLLAGQITDVRTLGMDEASSVAIVDFRVTNSSRYAFVVHSGEISILDAKGQARDGQVIAASDAGRLFELFPALGLKTGEPLIMKTRIAPGALFRGMLAARFEVPKADLDDRKKITVSITEVDGAVSELSR